MLYLEDPGETAGSEAGSMYELQEEQELAPRSSLTYRKSRILHQEICLSAGSAGFSTILLEKAGKYTDPAGKTIFLSFQLDPMLTLL